jgi:hypothetical protein
VAVAPVVFRAHCIADRISLPLRSPKLFTLGAVYDGTAALLDSVPGPDYEAKVAQALAFWEAVAANLTEWGRVESGDLKPVELRQEFIHSHAVVLWALGTMGRTLMAMIRHYNYTNRLKIPRENVRIVWVDDGGGALQFRAEVNLELDRLLDPAGLVFVEAHSGAVVMRFAYGTVAHREPPEETRLSAFPPGLRPLFRVRVIDPSQERRVLAWADAISPLTQDEIDSGHRSILPVETIDLGQRVWNLRIEGNSFTLQLNSSIRTTRDITAMAKDPDFIGLVYPAVIRQILQHLYFGAEAESVDNTHEWLDFGAILAGQPAPTPEGLGEDEKHTVIDDWISAVTTGFCENQHAADMFVKFKKESETSNE